MREEKGRRETKLEGAAKKKGLLVIVSGPSGSGKTTIVERLSGKLDFEKSISATTRKKRKGEKDGRDYYFLERKNFENKIREGYFLEHACVFGHYYGTPREEALRAFEQGKTFLLEIDVQGASQVMKKHTGALSIFIQPPENEKTLVERLKGRSTEDDAEIEKRIQTARREMAEKAHYQYVVENDELDRAVDEVKRIIERAERGK